MNDARIRNMKSASSFPRQVSVPRHLNKEISGNSEVREMREIREIHRGVCYRLYKTGIKQTRQAGQAKKTGQTGQRDVVLRVPVRGVSSLSPIGDLERIGNRYNQFAATGYCVAALKVFEINDSLAYPDGAIMTEHITGRRVQLPADFSYAAECLLALHQSEPDGDIYETAKKKELNLEETIKRRMRYLESAPIEQQSKQLIRDIKEKAEKKITNGNGGRDQDTRSFPIMADTHPGNFIVTEQNGKEKMIAIDVESDYTGDPVWDLAHFSLFSSLLWCHPEATPLSASSILSFYEKYCGLNAASPKRKQIPADSLTPARCLAARRQILCRTLGWMLSLMYLAKVGEIHPPRKALETAYHIVSPDNLIKIIRQEEELNTAWIA